MVEYPSASRYVLSVGGTTLSIDTSGNYISESAWSSGGGGASVGEAEPAYQTNYGISLSGRGTRPSAPKDQRTASAYIFGAICPAKGAGAGLVMPHCTTEAMSLHLAEIAQAVAPGAHAVLMLDQAGWHTTRKLVVPANITLLPLPPKCPELNAMENIWQFMRDNWLSNRIFAAHDDIVDHCCHAWNKLVAEPWRIMSIGLRDWAHGF